MVIIPEMILNLTMKESFEMKKVLSIWVALLGALLTFGCQTEKMPVEEVAVRIHELELDIQNSLDKLFAGEV